MSGDILDTILAVKRDEITALRKRHSESSLRELAAAKAPPRDFSGALRAQAAASKAAVIAEIKKASPSKGVIRADFDPAFLARDYARGGAACLSVLTDEKFFQGHEKYLVAARNACSLPVIRKDFLVDSLQVLESRAMGADCVLLIAAALERSQLSELYHCARSAALDVLVEIHDRAELETVARADLSDRLLIGVNNRNLRSFEVRLETTLELLPLLPSGWEVVTESGIGTPADVARMRAAGVQRFLVGESLMRQPSPGDALHRLIGA